MATTTTTTETIRTNLTNGLDGDQRVRLVIIGGEPAVETNAGHTLIDVSGAVERHPAVASLDEACEDLGCNPEQIRRAAVAAYPAAADWDWAAD